jgi:hypothetical protein
MIDPSAFTGWGPLGAVVFLVISFGGGLLVAARWAWTQIKQAINDDRTWRDIQNEKREQAQAAQSKSWQDTIRELTGRWEAQDKQREVTLSAIAAATNQMLERLDLHDQHARSVAEAVKTLTPKVEAALEQKTLPRRRT